jgi:hypothetical protein
MFLVLNVQDNKKLSEWGYQKLGLMRKALSEKWRYELPCGEGVVDGMLCVYERLRKIEMKRERWKSSKSSKGVMVIVDRQSGKSKVYG